MQRNELMVNVWGREGDVNSNVNNSLFLQNTAMGVSWPHHFHSALKLAAKLC